MRYNFVNDIGDYAKYALLRALCASEEVLDMRLGVIWYLTVHQELNSDGRKRAHLSHKGWDGLDSELLGKMRSIEENLRDQSDLHLSLVEQADILPKDTVFFSDPLPNTAGSPLKRREERASWFARAQEVVADCQLIFLDPDNGLEVRSIGSSSQLAGKYATVAEISSLLSTGAGVVFYQHGDRSPWTTQRSRIRDQILSGMNQRNVTIRSVRFRAFGSRAFFCVSSQGNITQSLNESLKKFEEHVSTWGKSRYFLFE
jgi:hypothetical protein